MKSKSQRYADVVFPNVQEVATLQQEGADDQAKKYKSLCKKAGALIRISGLVQAIAFFVAKGQRKTEAHHQVFLRHLQAELYALKLLGNAPADDGGLGLLEKIRALRLPQYMVMTREVLQLCNWHKRLADTLIIVTSDDRDSEEA